MTISEDIFRAYDIRGIVETALTPDAVTRIGQAFASEARAQGQNTVVIGRDGRLSSPELASVLSDGLRAGGCEGRCRHGADTGTLLCHAQTRNRHRHHGHRQP